MNTSMLIDHVAARYGRLIRWLHHGLALVGVAAIGAFALPNGGQAARAQSEDGAASVVQVPGDANTLFSPVAKLEDARYRALATYFSRRYRVAPDAAEHVIGLAFDAGARVELDPLLILAVIAIESGFNPIAESVFGAKGLMQVIPKHHQDKIGEHGGEQSVLNPVTNILVGARILKDYIRRTGSLESGLQSYNGALADGTTPYAQKVMAEQGRIRQSMLRLESAGHKLSAL